MISWQRGCVLVAVVVLTAACTGGSAGPVSQSPAPAAQNATPIANPIDPCQVLNAAQVNSAAGGEWQQQPGSATPDQVNYGARTCKYVSGVRSIGVTTYPQHEVYDKLTSSFSSQQAYVESVTIQSARKAAYYGPTPSRPTGILVETDYGVVELYATDTASRLDKPVWAKLATDIAGAHP